MSKASVEKLFLYASMVNIAEELDEDQLQEIAETVVTGFEEDMRASQEWRDNAERALELASLKREPKHYPMPNSSNVKHPLITEAANQFTARTLPELIKSGEVAKYKIIGRDINGAKDRLGKRITTHLNYQILTIMDNWMEDHDRLLMHLSIVGTVFSKTWFDPIEGINKSNFLRYDEIIVNNSIASIESAERISHLIYLTENELVEHQRYGLFSEIDDEKIEEDESDTVNAQELIEQHCFLDLDEDGYKEPYIVTLHKQSNTVVRISPRFNEQSIILSDDRKEVKKIFGRNYFSDYHFIHDPAGGFLSIGFGTLLLDLTESVNTVLNQLLDAGRLANIQGGFISAGLRKRAKTIDHEPGEWLTMESVDGTGLKNNIVPLNYKEPSMVLFQLLGLLIESGKSLTSTTEALTGTADSTNVSPNVMMSLVQQGLKVFTAIQRRVFRGYGKEFQKLIDLNRVHLDYKEYIEILDPTLEERDEMVDAEGNITDYLKAGLDIIPVADINTATEAERYARSQSELQGGLQLVQAGGANVRGLAANFFRAIESEDIERLVAPEPDPNQPNPEIIKLQHEMQQSQQDLAVKEKELELKFLELYAKIEKMRSESIKNIADAEAAEAGIQVQQYNATVQGLATESKVALEQSKAQQEALAAQGAATTDDDTTTPGPTTGA